MDFHRIDKNTVQCRMTEEEMNEYGFEIEDFFTNQEKSREFLEHIVERAEEEIGYQVESGMVSMQLMRMPDNSLTITFSDHKESSLQNMLGHIQNLASMIDESTAEAIVDKIKGNEDEIASSINMDEFVAELAATDVEQKKDEQKKEYQKHMKEVEKKKKQKEKKQQNAARIFVFDQLRDIEKFASTISFEKVISSKLYKDLINKKYYLLVKKGKLSSEQYKQLCQQLSEYGKLCSMQPFAEQYCKEHFECIISKSAIKVLNYI